MKGTPGPPRYHKSWLLAGKFADSNSGGFSSPSPRCLQNSDWLPSYQHILKVHFPNLGVSEDCLYLNIYAPARADTRAKLPVRLRAALGAPASRSLGWAPGRLAGCLDSGPASCWVKGKRSFDTSVTSLKSRSSDRCTCSSFLIVLYWQRSGPLTFILPFSPLSSI